MILRSNLVEKHRLGDLVTFSGGFSFKSSDWKSSGIPVIKIANVRDGSVNLEGCSFIDPSTASGSADYKVQKGDLLMTLTGEIGAMGIYKSDLEARLNQRLCKVSIKKDKNLLMEYIHYFLSSPSARQSMWLMSKGAAQANISVKDIETLEIPVLALDEQRRIVETLDEHLSRLDKALAEIYSADLSLTNLKHAHLDSLFMGELDPFPSVPLSALGRWVTGSTPKSSNTLYQGDDVPFVTPGDVYYGDEILSVSRRISNLGADSVRRLPAPSVQVVCIGATLGKVGYSLREVTTNQQITSLLPDVNVISAPFAAWLLSSPLVQSLLWQSSSSTTVPILNKGTLEQIEVPLAPLEKQSEILSQIESQAELSRSVLERITTATQTIGLLKRSILHRAFSGNQQQVEA